MIDSNEWKVRIYEEPETGYFKLYIISNSPGNNKGYISDIQKGTITYVKEGEAIKQAAILTRGMMEALFKAIQGQGIKPVEQSYVEGKFQATEKHLEDMRTLLKLTGKIYE